MDSGLWDGRTGCVIVEILVENEEDVGVKVDCSDAFNTSELFVQFVVVGTVIILHRCLLMANLI